jgi:molybdopterin converting factor small subunit
MQLFKTINVRYSPILQEQSGITGEMVLTEAANPGELFKELSRRHGFQCGCGIFKIIINDEIESFTSLLKDGDTVIFYPPIAGG